ncbi:filamentous hemagglutinin N-terminal domain-containing protein [Phormidesmis sp. 146-35]
MTQSSACWQQPLQLLVIGGILALSPLSVAQLAPIADDTLGNERSIVSPNQVINGLPSNQINGGAQRGANLFHSFREFNIDNGRGVYFSNPAGVANILTRVTGGNQSQILGTLGVLGNANLFLINPNGILFGSNAQLGLGGSFIASTANSFVFDNRFAFSATNPQAPPLLTVTAPIGLQFGSTSGEMRSQGAILRVLNGQTLTLAGGTVNVNGGQLLVPGGRVGLAGVAGEGEVGLTQQGQEWRLNIPDGLARADVAIGNNANVNVRAGSGGSIAITARNLTITGVGTGVRAGIAAGSGTIGAQAGDININATESVDINASLILNAIQPGSTGKAGNIDISAGAFTLTNGAQVSAITQGQGDAGNITITARDRVTIDGTSDNGFGTALFTSVDRGAIGQGGDISITTGTLSLINGGQVTASTRRRNASLRGGQGNAGNVTIMASDSVSINGRNPNGFASSVLSSIETGAIGQGGDIRITTGTLSLSDGGGVEVSTFGQGDAGDISITARDAVSFDGSSFASSSVWRGAVGQGGDIRITTGTLSLTNRAQVGSATFGQGNAGNLTITATDKVSLDGESGAFSQVGPGGIGQGGVINIITGSLSLTNGAILNTNTYGQGDAGNIIVTATDRVSFDGVGSEGIPSTAFSQVDRQGIGRGGNISITTATLSFTNRGGVTTSTFGRGNAGNIIIAARDTVSFDDGGGAGSAVAVDAIGQGGNVSITTGSLSFTNGSVVNASTAGQGDAGNITIVARDAVSFDGVGRTGFSSGAYSAVDFSATGQGGNITVKTGLFSITNGGILAASSQGQGDAGNIDVTARQLRLDNQSTIQAETALGQGGNINLQVQDYLLLRRGSLISTTAGTAQAGGDGGNITSKGNFIVAVPNENSDISANAFTGRGGRVEISAQSIFGIQPRLQLTPLSDITASSDFGVAGVVDINTPDVDPNRGLVQLPVNLTDASRLIVQACPTGSTIAQQSNEFIITGRGGLPPTPNEAVNQDAIQVKLVTADVEGIPPVSQRHQPAPTIAPPIVEAQRLQVMADGTVFLMAALPDPVAPLPDRLVPCP